MKSINITCILFILLLLPYCKLSARPTTIYEAESVVTGWLQKEVQPLGVSPGHQVTTVDRFVNNDGVTVYYIVYLKPSGFVIVSSDDLIEPIIGFADDGTFDPSLDNPLGALVNNDLNNRIYHVQNDFSLMAANGTYPKTREQNKWQTYLNTAENSQSGYSLMGLTSLYDVRVTPLVQSRWNQADICGENCYNYYTPKKYPCGCLATAMAQLMRYFEYPTSGIGKKEFEIYVNNKRQTATTVGGDENGGSYKWSQMVLRPDLNCADLTLAQRQAIGSICYDAGVAINMIYKQSGSGAYMIDARVALEETFGYSNIILGFNDNKEIDTNDLYNMINPSLDAGSPVILGIFASPNFDSGHAVLCDGYAYDSSLNSSGDVNSLEKSTMYHHLNMGWSGADDAWYNLPDINGQQKFNTITTCLYNIFTSDIGEIISGRVLDPNNKPVGNAVVYAKSDSTSSTLTDYRGIYAFKGLSPDTSYLVWANIDGQVTPQQTIQTKLSQDGQTDCGNIRGVDFHAETEPNYVPLETFYVDDNAPNDPIPFYSSVSDSNEDGSHEHPFDSIQEAIDAASHGDLIIISRGTYTGTGNRDIDFNGKAITVRGEDPNDPNLVIIDCGGTKNNPHRAFIFQNYEIPKSMLSGITIKGGYYEQGGAIYLTGCTRPTITNCVFISNKASVGGAIYNDNSSPVISGCTFGENQADAGGAIYNISSVSGCTPVISNCIFHSNSSTYNGGAIYNNDQVSPVLTKCTFTSNYSSGGGGAIRNNNTKNLTVTNCIFSTNSAATFGGGIRSSNGSNAGLTNCTFFANLAYNGKSLACTADDEGKYKAGSIQISNCIIRDGGGEIFNSDNSIINVTYSNIIDANDAAPWPGEGNIYADPNFADIEKGDLHLKSQAGRYDPNSMSWIIDDVTSPCIDAGDPQSSVDKEPQPNGGVINMGAYGGTDHASKTYSE